MSTLTAPRPATPPAPPRTAPSGAAPHRRRRWLRLAAPLLVVLVLLTATVTAYALQQPDRSDPAYLSPTSGEPTGASRLAALVRQRGGTVERATRTSDALVAAFHGDATLFIPAPAAIHPFYLRMLKLMPASTRIVLVAPTDGSLALGHLPVRQVGERWATRVGPPGCAMAGPAAAGTAAAHRATFTVVDDAGAVSYLHRCYGDGLVELHWYDTSLTVIGADDPFRNDRIDEHGNAALAAGLLTGTGRVIWLDVHRIEPAPGVNGDPGSGGPAPPSLSPGGSPNPDFPLPGGDPGGGRGDGGGSGAGGDDGGRADGGQSPLSAFPPVTWAALALLLAAGVLLAAARARRLGGPVPEPLPVVVPAAETVLGRGRLYQRARARGPAVAAVLSAARSRLLRLLDLPADTDDDTLTAAAAARSGWDAEAVAAALHPPEPDDDTLLVTAATNLSDLVRAVSRTDEGEQP